MHCRRTRSAWLWSDEPFLGGILMHVKSFAAVVAAVLLCAATGCHLAGTHGGACGGSGCDAGTMGCDSCGGGCTSGSCGGLVGLLSGKLGGGKCTDPANCVTPETLTGDGYGVRGGQTGPLAGYFGQHHRGPQSHMGGMPGPADGPPSPTVTYPYYTTRGPRDFFAANPASIGP